ncbi:MAG: RIP metalloprotease RseP [Prevotellaceae bacterium]|jgi:regulator of sigma E protease|nr:RIP metalloprotease RseP [Prevotellaceae bacterium]
MEIILKIVQLLLSLSILVIVHELGHFLFARLFRMRVDKFYLFFHPSFSVLRAKKINGKWNFSFFSSKAPEAWAAHPKHTEFGIGWLPVGGYCKIAGMVDESLDKEQLRQPPQPWEFRTKPTWQRFFVMTGGVLFNLILAVILYAGMLCTWGERYLANDDVIYGVKVNELTQELGFQNGDKIIAFDGQPVALFDELQISLVQQQAKTATVVRNSDTLTVHIDPQYLPAMLNYPNMFPPVIPFVVAEVPDTSHNAHAGLQPGDHFVTIDGAPILSIEDGHVILEKKKQQTVHAGLQRHDSLITVPLLVNNEGKIGVVLKGIPDLFHITVKHYSLLAALPAGAVKGYNTVKNYIKQLQLIFSPKTEAYKSVGSFITIGKIFPGTWNWHIFWNITAFLSIMLAVLNILPIPGLDGGHTLFVLYEMVTRRKPSEKFLEYTTYAGLLFLIGIMALAFGNDIFRLFK